MPSPALRVPGTVHPALFSCFAGRARIQCTRLDVPGSGLEVQAPAGPGGSVGHSDVNVSVKRNHYETLRVAQTASCDQIRASFRRLAKVYHPDRKSSVLFPTPWEAYRYMTGDDWKPGTQEAS